MDPKIHCTNSTGKQPKFDFRHFVLTGSGNGLKCSLLICLAMFKLTSLEKAATGKPADTDTK